jgi:putative phosphoribosyl transferase
MAYAFLDDRRSAGRELARRISQRAFTDPVVLALPRGGVPVAFEIAEALGAPLDLLLVRKVGLPGQPELALAAIVDGERPDLVLNDEVVALSDLDADAIRDLAARELKEIERRRAAYMGSRPPVQVAGRSAIVVDDGIATGASMRAALVALRRRAPKEIVLAVPVAPSDTLADLRPLVDDVVCLAVPEPFHAIGLHYRDFHQLSDREVIDMLAKSSSRGPQTYGRRQP